MAWARDRLDHWVAVLEIDHVDAAALAESIPDPDADRDAYEAFETCRQRFVADWPGYDFHDWPMPGSPADTPLVRAHVLLSSLDQLVRFHHDRGVPDDITTETIGGFAGALRTHRDATGSAGVDATGWFVWFFRGAHYRLGRLTVLPLRLLTAPDPRFWYDDATAASMRYGFRRDDPVLSVHIPRHGELTRGECDTAFARMARAFDAWFPEGPPRLAICTSWTLDPQLADYLPADSNLVHWQRRFTLVPDAKDSDFIMSFVFGDRPEYSLDELPQQTTLQRAVVTHLRAGKRWQVRTGWLDLDAHRR